jgi:tripartite-type tricarboxylate transporter receptor subunit TctC
MLGNKHNLLFLKYFSKTPLVRHGVLVLLGLISAAALAQAPAGSGTSAGGGSGGGSAWPSRPVRWIVPFAPGGPTDVVVRVVAPKLSERIGQPVLIENRAGAAGNIGTELAARAAPDGHTLLYVVPALVTNPYFMKSAVDPRELAAVVQTTRMSMVLVTNPGFAARNVAEAVAAIRARPGSVSCASSGSLPTVGCELLRAHAGADMIMVMYKGNAPALQALLAGEVNLLFDVINTSLPQIRAGRARALASLNPKRGGVLPELPAMNETIPGFELVTWQGVVTAAGTPRELLTRINREFNAVLEQPEIRQRLTDTGLELAGGSSDQFEERLRSDAAKFGRALREAGIKPE